MGIVLAPSNVQKFIRKINYLKLSSFQRQQLHELMEKPIFHVANELFESTAAMQKILEIEIQTDAGATMSTEQTRISFLQLNYIRCQMARVRRKLLRARHCRREDAMELLRWNERNLQVRERIISANMRLVLAMAKRSNYPNIEVTDLISEGSMALLRASEKFDVSRGLKFSTYACQAIFKGFSRAAKQTYRHHNMFPAQWDPALEKDDSLDQQRLETHSDLVDEVRAIVNHNLADLTDTELSIVRMRFSLEDTSQTPLTLKQVGDKLGLTKERIRQIQNKALAKLRLAAEERMLNN